MAEQKLEKSTLKHGPEQAHVYTVEPAHSAMPVEAHTHEHHREYNAGAYVSHLPKFQKTETGNGTFYGVSVGPGDSGHLTLNAVQTIMHCPVIAAPQTRSGEMLAYTIAKSGLNRFLELSFGSRMAEASEESFWAAKTVLPVIVPMSINPDAAKAAYREAADEIERYLNRGMDVAMLNLGDVSIYATCQYIAELLKNDGYAVKFVAGVPSFCAAAASLGTSLTEAGTPVYILPGAINADQARELLEAHGTKILMKTGRSLPETISFLKAQGYEQSTSAVVNCGLPNEKIYPTLAEFETALLESPESTYSYFTILLVKPTEETT